MIGPDDGVPGALTPRGGGAKTGSGAERQAGDLSGVSGPPAVAWAGVGQDADTRLRELLEASAALHHHLCPRQVLGVRIGLLAGETLAVLIPQTDKRLLTIVETDGCVTDGIAVATNCWVGRRTMRIEDYGKVAATFVDCRTDRAIRIAPRPEARQLAPHYAPDAASKWQAYLLGYQRMPASELLTWHAVKLVTPVQRLLSRPDVRAVCQTCGEEIINERQVLGATGVQCRACARGGYYVVGE